MLHTVYIYAPTGECPARVKGNKEAILTAIESRTGVRFSTADYARLWRETYIMVGEFKISAYGDLLDGGRSR